ncbi:MAG: lipopolysaccharide biosynthesis protein [Acidobacteriota bacterium]|nr:lipopolysaccharide biosynthesis protein [Acidobacteriota bacterium]
MTGAGRSIGPVLPPTSFETPGPPENVALLDGVIENDPSMPVKAGDHRANGSMKLPSLQSSFLWMLTGNVIYAVCQWGMLISMAKLGTATMVGQFSLGLAICTPVLMFTNLQLRAVLATDAKRQYWFVDYVSLRVIMTVVASLLIFLVVTTGSYLRETAQIIAAVAASKCVESFSDILYGLFQKEERLDKIAISFILRGIASVGVLTAVLYKTRSAFWGFIAITFVWTLILIAHDIPFAWKIVRRHPQEPLNKPLPFLRSLFSFARVRLRLSLVRLAFPLGIGMVLCSLNVNVPRYFVHAYMGERTLGVFSALAYPVAAIVTVIDALGHSAIPRLAKYYSAGRLAAFRLVLLKLVSIGALVGTAGVITVMFSGSRLLSLIYRPEYSEHVNVFIWIIAGGAIGGVASLLMYGLTSARRFTIQIVLLGLVVITSAVCCKILIPLTALLGAAYATVIASLVHLIAVTVVGFLMFRPQLTSGPAEP